jgi:FkbM family methyltransferase
LEKLPARIRLKLRALGRIAGRPRVVSVALRGGDVRAYLALSQEWFRQLGIRTVVDIGANVGQFAEAARQAFPRAALHCFEPLPDCFAQLARRFGRAAEVHLYDVALADQPHVSSMFRDSFSPSSSLLEMDVLHEREFPWTSGGERVTVRVSTLDAALGEVRLATPLLVKIDVQGAENLVIAGGRATLAQAAVAIVETSFEPLYKGQPLFNEIYDRMCREGFVYRGSLAQLTSPRDGRVLQADSVFVRP